MNGDTKWARRYHWQGDEVSDFVCEPHKAICCDHKNEALNMVSSASSDSRKACSDIVLRDPDKNTKEYSKILELKMAAHHDVRLTDIKSVNFKKILIKTYENKPDNFEALLSGEGVGPGTIRALALMSELIYGARPSFEDPVRYSFAHGGKDGFPYPVNRQRYDRSICLLREALSKAKIGHTDKLKAFRRLSDWEGKETLDKKIQI